MPWGANGKGEAKQKKDQVRYYNDLTYDTRATVHNFFYHALTGTMGIEARPNWKPLTDFLHWLTREIIGVPWIPRPSFSPLAVVDTSDPLTTGLSAPLDPLPLHTTFQVDINININEYPYCPTTRESLRAQLPQRDVLQIPWPNIQVTKNKPARSSCASVTPNIPCTDQLSLLVWYSSNWAAKNAACAANKAPEVYQVSPTPRVAAIPSHCKNSTSVSQPWSTSWPTGEDIPVRLACLPSTASQVWYISTHKTFAKNTYGGITAASPENVEERGARIVGEYARMRAVPQIVNPRPISVITFGANATGRILATSFQKGFNNKSIGVYSPPLYSCAAIWCNSCQNENPLNNLTRPIYLIQITSKRRIRNMLNPNRSTP